MQDSILEQARMAEKRNNYIEPADRVSGSTSLVGQLRKMINFICEKISVHMERS